MHQSLSILHSSEVPSAFDIFKYDEIFDCYFKIDKIFSRTNVCYEYIFSGVSVSRVHYLELDLIRIFDVATRN